MRVSFKFVGALFLLSSACTSVHGTSDGCLPDEVHIEDGCRATVGVLWDGERCTEAWGCSCVGCFESVDACVAAHGECLNTNTTSDAGSPATHDARVFHECDWRKIGCRASPPLCGAGEVPSVEGSCWGPCVPIETCGCGDRSAERYDSDPQCPLDGFVCRQRTSCGPLSR